MRTKWVVTTATERIVLDQARSGETTFTVTNPGAEPDQAVFDVVAGEDAEPDWFTVAEPQRLIRGGASMSYLVKVAIPAETSPGSYQLQGRVYSVDFAPEESSVLSPRVMLEVPAEPGPGKRTWPWWWWLVAAGLGVVVLVVAGVLVFGGGDDATGGQVVMPDLVGKPEREALQTLSDLGLEVEPIRYRFDGTADDQVVSQSYEAGTPVSTDALVNLVVAANFPAPELTGTGVPVVGQGDPAPALEWQQSDARVRQWRITLFLDSCEYGYEESTAFYVLPTCAFPDSGDSTVVSETMSFTPEPELPDPVQVRLGGSLVSGWVRWQVEPLDDFGTAGPASEPGYFRMELS